jgi:hypothetical protein
MEGIAGLIRMRVSRSSVSGRDKIAGFDVSATLRMFPKRKPYPEYVAGFSDSELLAKAFVVTLKACFGELRSSC